MPKIGQTLVKTQKTRTNNHEKNNTDQRHCGADHAGRRFRTGCACGGRPLPEHLAAKAAIKEINDWDTLARISHNHKDKWMRYEALEELNDQVLLWEIIKNDQDEWVRRSAVHLLDGDPALFSELAKTHEDFGVRLAAVGKLKDPALLMEIAKNDSDFVVRREAMLVFSLPNRDLLAQIEKSADKEARLIAVRNFFDIQRFLQEFAELNFKARTETEVEAMNKTWIEQTILFNHERLAEIVKKEEDGQVRQAIEEGLKNQALFVEAIKNQETLPWGRAKQTGL